MAEAKRVYGNLITVHDKITVNELQKTGYVQWHNIQKMAVN